jgi:NADPH2:quinone reductase
MHAIQIQKNGGPEVLEYVEIPTPKPAAGQVLVKIEAAGVNFIDVYFREGRYPAPLPLVPGQEAAGIVTAVGEGVTGFREGDHVAWTGTNGTYAEFACAPASSLLHVPAGLSSEDAAAALLQGFTAHYLSHDTYRIQPGDAVLVHAGAGGVGLLLTQIAKLLGATVITTVSTEEKAALSREAGADHAILYTQQNFREEVERITGGAKLPVVYDSVGKTTFEDSLQCLRSRGMMVLFGASSGAVPPFDLVRLAGLGSLFVTRPTVKDYTRERETLERRAHDIFGWISSGKLKMRIGHRYPLAEAAQAHHDLEGRKTTGKIVLIP